MGRCWIKVSQATAAKRYVYFHLVDATDGMTPETGENGGQPQISTNGAAFTNTGIGVLVAIGTGRYYAELTVGAIGTVGDIIETRYKSAATQECPGDSVQVVGFDPEITVPALVDQVWDEVLDATHHHGAASAGLFMQRGASFAEGTVQSATSTTLVLDSFMSSVDNYYRDCLIGTTTGTGLQQLRIVQSYVGASRTCVLASDRPWIVTPDATTTWEMYPAGPASVTNVSQNSITNITAGATAADVWAYATRTLTMAAAALASLSSGTELVLRRGDLWTQPITGLGNISTRTKLWLTIKGRDRDPDTASVIQMEETAGLFYVNGATYATAAHGSITVTNATTGAVTVVLKGVVAAMLVPGEDYLWDIQMLTASGPTTLAEGTLEVTADITRATS